MAERKDPTDGLHGLAGVIVHDSDGRIMSVSDRARQLMGITMDKSGVLRPPVWTFTNAHGEPVEPAELPPFLVAAVGHPTSAGLVGVDDGSPGGRRWLRVDCEEVRDQLGRVELMVTTVRDATTEHRSELFHRAATSIVELMTSATVAEPNGQLRETLTVLGETCEASLTLAIELDRSNGLVNLAEQWSPQGDVWSRDVPGAPIDLFAVLLPRLSRGLPVVVNDVRSVVSDQVLRGHLEDIGLRSGVAVPVMIGGRLEGFVNVSWRRARSVTAQAIELVELTAQAIALARQATSAAAEAERLRHRLAGVALDESTEAIGARRAELYTDVTPDLLLEIDRDDKLATIIMPAGYESSDLSALHGHNVLDVFSGDDRARLTESLRAVRDGSPIEVFEFQWPDGDLLRCFEARFTAGPDGKIISVVREVTPSDGADRARHEASHALAMANEELTRLVHERDQFLASVSHELRTPLNAILGLTEMLLDHADPLSSSQRATLRTIDSSGRHLLELINDLLDLSRLRASAVALDLRDIGVEEPCRWTLDLMRPRAVARGVRVEMVNPTGNLRLRADERRLRQILINLMDNAVNFTEPGGSAGLQVWQPDADHVALSVWDTGSGIAPADRSRIFEPFAQLSARRDGQRAGSGLGLSVVERLVALHEGRIEVDSVPGQGSRFTVVLPVAGPGGGAASDAGEQPGSTNDG